MTKWPKFKVGDEVIWNTKKFVIKDVRRYRNYCWVYEFEDTIDTIIPFHFSSIPESQISPVKVKRWWEFWK